MTDGQAKEARATALLQAATVVSQTLTARHKPIPYPHSVNGEIEVYCSWCASMCHSHSGLGCDEPHDGAWPCDGERLRLELIAKLEVLAGVIR